MLSSGSDLLTAVTDGTVSTGSKQNSTVSYDEMGNPTRYLGATMTWAGKQLKYWGKSGKYVNFAYNEDGIRTQKNADGILTNYYYNGSLLRMAVHVRGGDLYHTARNKPKAFVQAELLRLVKQQLHS